MRILDAKEVRLALPMPEAIQAVRQAFIAFSSGQAEMPMRGRLPVAPQNGIILSMPCFVSGADQSALSVKIVSVFPHNPAKNLPLIHAAVLVISPKNGEVTALLEGSMLTAIRTGAASGVATDLLAKPDSRVAALFGVGGQALPQVQAICAVRPSLQTIWVYAPTRAHVEQFIQENQSTIPSELRIAQSPHQAVENADVICTATTSTQPVFKDADLKPGVHINGVGSYTPDMLEIPPQTLARAEVFVDSHQAVMAEAGEILAAINQKILFPAELTELGEALQQPVPFHRPTTGITVFKSVGIAAQDALAAQTALNNAIRLGLGQQLNI